MGTPEQWCCVRWRRQIDLKLKHVCTPYIDRMISPSYEGERFAVRDDAGRCLSAEGEWEYEPQPSSRDDAFYERCRFIDFMAAAATLRKTEAADPAKGGT